MQALLRRLLPWVFISQRLQLDHGKADEGLALEFAAQQQGERTLLLAFRHPSPRDPLVLSLIHI